MKIDLEYLATIFNVFLEAETAHVDMEYIAKSGIDVGKGGKYNEKFIFHIQIAIDNQLIGQKSGVIRSLDDAGLRESLDGIGTIDVKPLRLTQTGHDFACSLNNKEVLTKLKSEFKDAPFKVVFEGGQKLLQHFMKKKLDEIIE